MSDMEGVSGVVKWQQVTSGEPQYEEGRKLYTQEINAAVRGARAGGATEVVVMDCHGAGGSYTFNSLVPELIEPGCDYVIQEKWTGYTGALEPGCDGALFVGMHARAGTQYGVLSHTVSSETWYNLYFNGRVVGETAINAALCGTWNCPVWMVTGDQATCEEAKGLLGEALVTVPVKQGLGRYTARNVPAVRAREMIEAGAKRAVSERPAVPVYDPGKPCEIKVELATPDRAEALRYKPGVELVDPRTIVSRAADWWTAWRQFWF
jgi:D-amino peptidase